MWRKMRVSVSYLQRFSYFLTLLPLWTLYQPKMCVFDVLEIELNNQPSLLCVQEQLGQILLILHLTLLVFDIVLLWRELQP